MQGDVSNAPDVIVQGALALTSKGHLLAKLLVNLLEAVDSFNGLLDQRGFNTFFHATLCFKINNVVKVKKSEK